MDKIFEYGIIWEPGAGGNFLSSRLLSGPDKFNFFPHINEYACGDEEVYMVRKFVKAASPNQFVLNSHQMPLEFFDYAENVRVKELLVLSPHWISFLLLNAKRLFNYATTPSQVTWLIEEVMRYPNPSIKMNPGVVQALADEIKDKWGFQVLSEDNTMISAIYIFIAWCYGNNMQVKQENFGIFLENWLFQATLSYRSKLNSKTYKFLQDVKTLSETGKMDKIIVGDYEELFYDLHVPWRIGTKAVAEYSLKNLGFLNQIISVLPPESRKMWEKFVNNQTTRVLSKL